MRFTVGNDAPITIDFIVDGDYVIPTAASLSVRGNSGALITGLINIALPTSTNTTIYTVLATNNTIASPKTQENRFVEVTFTYAGKVFHQTISYSVIPFLPITATPSMARRELGLDRSELADTDVDIYQAYLLLLSDYSTLATILIAGDVTAEAANQAIAITAALQIVDSLPFRAFVTAKSEDSEIGRQSTFDVEQIREALAGRLQMFMGLALGVAITGSKSFSLSTAVDVITGV